MYIIRPEYLFYLILTFIAIILILIGCILFKMAQKRQMLFWRTRITGQLSDWLTEIALEDEIKDEKQQSFFIPVGIRNILLEERARDILLDELILLRRSLSGSTGTNLERLYRQLDMDKMSIRKLQSRRWHIKAKGIQELTVMKQMQHQRFIDYFVNHSNPYLRMEAQTGLVRYWGFEGLHFLDFIKHPLTEWQQLNLLHILSQQSVMLDTPIVKWLNSANVSVIKFALKLVTEQCDTRYYEGVVQCLKHANEEVNVLAVHCLGEIPDPTTTKTLLAHYKNCSEVVRMAIIRVLRKIGTTEDLNFIIVKSTVKDLAIRVACQKSLLSIRTGNAAII